MDTFMRLVVASTATWILAVLPSLWGGVRAPRRAEQFAAWLLIVVAGCITVGSVWYETTKDQQRELEATTAALVNRARSERQRIFAARGAAVRLELGKLIEEARTMRKEIRTRLWTKGIQIENKNIYDSLIHDWKTRAGNIVKSRLPCAVDGGYDFGWGSDVPTIWMTTLDGTTRVLMDLSNTAETLIERCSPPAL